MNKKPQSHHYINYTCGAADAICDLGVVNLSALIVEHWDTICEAVDTHGNVNERDMQDYLAQIIDPETRSIVDDIKNATSVPMRAAFDNCIDEMYDVILEEKDNALSAMSEANDEREEKEELESEIEQLNKRIESLEAEIESLTTDTELRFEK